jgi:nesprin-1
MKDQANELKEVSGTRNQVEAKLASVRGLISSRSANLANLNAVIESGEKLYPTTGTEGREIIRAQIQELQGAFDSFYDDLGCIEREMNGKLTRWSGFEESKNKLKSWLSELEKDMPREIELKATLDEKRAQLQKYRSMLHDILSHQQDVIELRDKGSQLPEGAEDAVKLAEALSEKHHTLLQKSQEYVEQYEGIVCFHQQYVKAVQDTTEWTDGTHSTVIMWSDENQERINLHANLEKLKVNQQWFSYPLKFFKIKGF